MNPAYAPAFIGKEISIKSLRDFILDAGIRDVDTLLINPINFDQLALDYRQTFKQNLPDPYVLVGVLIREGHSVRHGFASVSENDTESIRVKPVEKVDPYRIIYRCGYCGNIVDHDGGELDPSEVSDAQNYLSKFWREATTKQTVGYCCKKKHYGVDHSDAEPVVVKRKNDYSAIQEKPLMDLTEDDFKQIGLRKVETAEFPIIYSCQNARLSKIYFTPNENSYTLRALRLEAQAEILSTDDLIQYIRDWRND